VGNVTIDRSAYLAALCRTVPYSIVEPVLANPVDDAIPKSEQFAGTLLYADLVGFTPLCEALAEQGPSGLGRLTQALNTLFTKLLEDAIFPFRGYVIQFGGDSLTAVFRGEDHARLAAASALAAQQLMRDELAGLLAAEGRELYLRIGLATGDLRLTVLGDAIQRGLAVAGAPAHRAVTLQRLANPGEIAIDERLATELADVATTTPQPSGGAVLQALVAWPTRTPIVPLEPHLVDRV
jgi:class 3 adenylate cyclase